jgi:hypothetical protein
VIALLTFCVHSAVTFHPYFEYSIDVLLVLNGIFFAFQTYFFVTGRFDRSVQVPFYFILFYFISRLKSEII